MDITQISYILGVLGTIAFSATAVLGVLGKKIDLFGACVMGIITAVGGGTIRDIILDVPVFWTKDQSFIWIALVSSMIAFYGNKLISHKNIYALLLYLDAIGVSMFVIQGAEKTINLDFAMPIGPIMLGLITSIGGGLIRDVLAENTNLLLKKEIYALPLSFGAILYVILYRVYPEDTVLVGVFCVLLTFSIRAASIYWKFTVPQWMFLKNEDA